MRKVGAAFLSRREVSSQECVYRRIPELWLRKGFPKKQFLSQRRLALQNKKKPYYKREKDATSSRLRV